MPLTEKSFSKGSELPPLTKGTLRLYSMRFCPFAQRTRLVLFYKNIPHETVNVDLSLKPDWFWEKNPGGMVPVLELDDNVVYESLITCDYLDDLYPDNRLTPADPFKKARDGMLIDYYGNKFVSNYYKLMRTEGKDEQAKETMTKSMQKLEEELAARGKFFGGDKLAMIDLMLWPWFERVPYLKEFNLAIVPSETAFPRMYAWIENMLQQPAVKATCFDYNSHVKFLNSYFFSEKADCDIGLSP